MAATAPGTHLSHWAMTRVFDRLEGFGKVREPSGHASAIRASQAPTWKGAPALSSRRDGADGDRLFPVDHPR
ncbi:hypothetical protein [Shinella yambaruensis]|uniref:hypothetical protein n=1 Tax=Shinella yambaruensis TaxID=415996 RepID=UPI0037D9BC28